MEENNQQVIEELRAVIGAQQELLRVALWVMTQGSADFCGKELSCVLAWDQARAASTLTQ